MKDTTKAYTAEFLNVNDIMKITGAAKSTIYSWVKQGSFPKPVTTGPNSSRFRLRDVKRWCEDPVKWRERNGSKQQ